MKLFNDLGYKILWAMGVLGTLAAPVTTGYVIAHNLIKYKYFPWPFGLSAAIAVETMGFTASTVGLSHYGKDAQTGKRFGSLPTWLSVLSLLGYVAVAMLLTYAVETDVTLALFPLLSLIGSMILALIQELKRRTTANADAQAQRVTEQLAQERKEAQRLQLEAARQAERDRLLAERQARIDEAAHQERLAEIQARKEAKIARVQQAQLTGKTTGKEKTITPRITSEERRNQLREMFTTGNSPNVTELSGLWNVSKKTIYQDIELVKGNGNGNGYHEEKGG